MQIYFNFFFFLDSHWLLWLLIYPKRSCWGTVQCQRSRQAPEEAERDGTQACTVSHDRKPDTQPRDGYQHCHRLLFLSPTVSPPQPCNHLAALILTHSHSSSYRKYVIEIEVGGAWACFAVDSSSLCYLCTGLDHNHRVKKRMRWFATVSFSQYWPRRLSLTQLWGLLVVLNVLEVTYHMHVNLETSRGS